jgi:hypothetical protein
MRGRWGLGHSVKLDIDMNIETLQPAAWHVYMQRYFAETTVMEIESSCPCSRACSADGVTWGRQGVCHTRDFGVISAQLGTFAGTQSASMVDRADLSENLRMLLAIDKYQ